MLWPLEAATAPTEQFADLAISEVLYDFDGPRIFTTESGGLMRLWYQAGEDDDRDVTRYLVVPTDGRLVSQLKSGRKTVHDALDQPWIWIVDAGAQREALRSWVVGGLHEVPGHAKPEQHAPLLPEHVPLFTYRLIGEGLHEGAVPASVIARAVERPTAALKKVLESVMDRASQGRPHEGVRQSYDLPATRFAFNSFEVSFGIPGGRQLPLLEDGQNVYEASANKLYEALAWVSDPDGSRMPDAGMLEVLKELAPPAHGVVTATEIRSRFVASNMPVHLDRTARSEITRAIGATRALRQSLIQVVGRLGQLDKDNLSFQLRDRSDGQPEIKCVFSEEQFDDVLEVFFADRRVVIQGRMSATKNVLELVAMEPEPTALPPAGS